RADAARLAVEVRDVAVARDPLPRDALRPGGEGVPRVTHVAAVVVQAPERGTLRLQEQSVQRAVVDAHVADRALETFSGLPVDEAHTDLERTGGVESTVRI